MLPVKCSHHVVHPLQNEAGSVSLQHSLMMIGWSIHELVMFCAFVSTLKWKDGCLKVLKSPQGEFLKNPLHNPPPFFFFFFFLPTIAIPYTPFWTAFLKLTFTFVNTHIWLHFIACMSNQKLAITERKYFKATQDTVSALFTWIIT